MGGSGGSDGSVSIRYPQYLEERHNQFITGTFNAVGDRIGNSPYASITVTDISDAFFGTGLLITDYPSLYETFETYITDVNAETLFNSTLDDIINNPVISNDIASEALLLDDEIEQVALPRFTAGMRDINAVMSTGFIHGKVLLEANKIKAVNKYASALKVTAIGTAQQVWTEKLKWNIAKTELYMKLSQFYWLSYYDNLDTTNDIAVKNSLWPLTVYDYERAALGALSGGSASGAGQSGPTRAQKAVGGALSGASSGAMIGAQTNTGWVGAAVGGIAGAILGGVGGYNS